MKKRTIRFSYVRKGVFFYNKKPINPEFFLEKTLIFVDKIKERVNKYVKTGQKTWSIAEFEPATSGFRTAVTPDFSVIQDTNSADY